MEQAGTTIDLKKGSCRKELLTVLRLILKEARWEQQTEAQKVAEEAELRARRPVFTATENAQLLGLGTFTHKSRVAGRVVSAERLQTTLGMLKRMGSKPILKFITAAAVVIFKEQTRLWTTPDCAPKAAIC